MTILTKVPEWHAVLKERAEHMKTCWYCQIGDTADCPKFIHLSATVHRLIEKEIY